MIKVSEPVVRMRQKVEDINPTWFSSTESERQIKYNGDHPEILEGTEESNSEVKYGPKNVEERNFWTSFTPKLNMQVITACNVLVGIYFPQGLSLPNFCYIRILKGYNGKPLFQPTLLGIERVSQLVRK